MLALADNGYPYIINWNPQNSQNFSYGGFFRKLQYLLLHQTLYNGVESA